MVLIRYVTFEDLKKMVKSTHYLTHDGNGTYQIRNWKGRRVISTTDAAAAIRAAIADMPQGWGGAGSVHGDIMCQPNKDAYACSSIDTQNGIGAWFHVPDDSAFALRSPAWKSVKFQNTVASATVRAIQTNPSVASASDTGGNNVQSNSTIELENLVFDANRSTYTGKFICIENTKQFFLKNLSIRNDANPTAANMAGSIGLDLKESENERSSAINLSINRFDICGRNTVDHLNLDNVFVGEHETAGWSIGMGVGTVSPYDTWIRKLLSFNARGNPIYINLNDAGEARCPRIDDVLQEGDPAAGLTASCQPVINNVLKSYVVVGTVIQRGMTTRPALFTGNVGIIQYYGHHHSQFLGVDGYMRKPYGNIHYLGGARNNFLRSTGEVTTGTITYSSGTQGDYEQAATGAVINTDAGYKTANFLRRNHNFTLVQRFQLSQATNIRGFIGASDQTLAAQLVAEGSLPAGSFIGLEFDTSVNANFKMVTNNSAGAATVFTPSSPTSYAIDTNPYALLIAVGQNGSTKNTAHAELWRGDADAAYWTLAAVWQDLSGDLPVLSTAMGMMYGIENLAASDMNIKSFGQWLNCT